MSSVALIVEKNGNIKECKIKDKKSEYEINLLCGNKKKEIKFQTSWNLEMDKKYKIELYAKKKGRAGQENKYELPPPVDKDLYFGSMLLINKLGDLKSTEWEDIYNYLYGGFEELEEDEEEEEDDNEEYNLTKEGYVKDDFVVDDEENSDDDYVDDDEEDEVEYKKETKQKIEKDEEYINSSGELQMEEYF